MVDNILPIPDEYITKTILDSSQRMSCDVLYKASQTIKKYIDKMGIDYTDKELYKISEDITKYIDVDDIQYKKNETSEEIRNNIKDLFKFYSDIKIIKKIFNNSTKNLDLFFSKFSINLEELHSNNIVILNRFYPDISNLKKIQYKIVKIEPFIIDYDIDENINDIYDVSNIENESTKNKKIIIPIKTEYGYKIDEDIIEMVKQYDIYHYKLLYEIYKYVLLNF